MLNIHNHPFSRDRWEIPEHRYVFYCNNDVDASQCHVCTKPLDRNQLTVDHLNHDKLDNSVENLRAACGICNSFRERERMQQTWRNKVGIEYAGKKLTMWEWSRQIGITHHALKNRIKKWGLEKALTTPKFDNHDKFKKTRNS